MRGKWGEGEGCLGRGWVCMWRHSSQQVDEDDDKTGLGWVEMRRHLRWACRGFACWWRNLQMALIFISLTHFPALPTFMQSCWIPEIIDFSCRIWLGKFWRLMKQGRGRWMRRVRMCQFECVGVETARWPWKIIHLCHSKISQLINYTCQRSTARWLREKWINGFILAIVNFIADCTGYWITWKES